MKELYILKKPLILTSLASGVLYFLLPIYSRRLNMNAIEISGLFSIVSFVLMFMKPIIGKSVDKVGRKPILLSSILAYILAYIVFAFSDTVFKLYLARMIQGLAGALMAISTYAIVYDLSKEKKDFSEGFGFMNSAESKGCFYGAIISALVLWKSRFLVGWKIIFIIYAIGSAYAFFMVMKNLPETKRHINYKVEKKKTLSKEAVNLLIISFIVSLASSMLGPLYMIYLQDKFMDNIMLLSLGFFPALILEIMLSQKIGVYAKKLGKKKAMIIGSIISLTIIIFIPKVSSIIVLSSLWCISTISGLLYDLSQKGIYTEVSDHEFMGEMYGVYSLVCNLGVIIGPILGGIFYEKISPETPFYVYSAIMIIVVLLISLLIKDK